MKINWGISIAIFYLSFMLVMIFFVIRTTTYDNSLVVDNYYEEDLKYQSHFDKKANTQALKKQVDFEFSSENKTIEIHFPKDLKKVDGNIRFYNPISKYSDVLLPITTDSNQTMSIALNELKAGRWKILLDWNDGEKEYYSETEIVL